jgi:hypothetical protein
MILQTQRSNQKVFVVFAVYYINTTHRQAVQQFEVGAISKEEAIGFIQCELQKEKHIIDCISCTEAICETKCFLKTKRD